MTEPGQNFVRLVAEAASKQLLGQVDYDEDHSIRITNTSIVTRDDGTLALEIIYVGDGVERHLGWSLAYVDDFIADTVATSVEYLTSLIRIEIMERVDTREF